MEYQEFLTWLENERAMSNRSERDVVSRLRRVVNLLGEEVIDEASVEKLNENSTFDDFSMYIKSQLRRSVKLYMEYSAQK
jgi:hypothetical protein